MIVVVINEQHKLLPEQRALLERLRAPWAELRVPAGGWPLAEIRARFRALRGQRGVRVLFVSPIPAAMRVLGGTKWGVFHNDKREKRELPDGRIVAVTAKTGWEIVWS